MKKLMMLTVSLAAAAIGQPAAADALSVKSNGLAAYKCGDGTSVSAEYFGLSDGTLFFVKATIGKDSYTLPQVLSASGTRYTDLVNIEWWEHQGEVSLDLDVNSESNEATICKPQS